MNMISETVTHEVWVVLNPNDTVARVFMTEQEAADYADGERGNPIYPPLRYGMAVLTFDNAMVRAAA